MEYTYTVQGMTCGHCAQAVKAEVEKLHGVLGATVTVETGAVVVVSDREVNREMMRIAVDEAGYVLAGS